MTMTLLSAPVTPAAAISIDVPTTMFAISKLGDLTLVVSEGVPQAIVARGQEFAGKDVYFTVNGVPYTAYALLTSNLTLQGDTMPLKFDHEGTLDFANGDDMISLKYEGVAEKTKDMEMNAKKLNSYGDFVVTKAAGVFADLEGAMGTYTLTVMCERMPGEHPKVGDMVKVTFAAMSE
jgi:hypothetical protein